MSSDEPQIKYQEVSPFQISEGFTPSNVRSHTMEPVKTGRIFLAAVAANLSAFAVGTCLGWTSPVTPKLKTTDTSDSPLDSPIDSTDEAWISSIVALGALVAPFVAGYLADIIGRKWTLLFNSVFVIVGYALLMVGREVWVLLVARLITGFGAGFVMTVLPMYVGEIATAEIRGTIGTLMNLFLVSGVLYVYAIGPYVSYQALQWFCLVLPIIFDLCFFWMPESPYYLVSKGREEEALRSIQFLRSQSADAARNELSAIKSGMDESKVQKGSVMDVFRMAGNRKALLISVGLLVLQQVSGINAIQFNSQSIFSTAGTDLDPAIATIIVGIVQVSSSILAPIVADRLPRKVILLSSAGVMAVALIAMGIFFYLKLEVGDVNNLQWLPITALVIHMIMYSVGFGSLPWAILGEMFGPNVKSIAASIATCICGTTGFVTTYIYPFLEDLGTHYVFWIFGVFDILAFFFVLFVVMETRGLSLQDIQDKLHAKKI